MFTDRFPFLYLFNDYSIKYYAAFNGCSAETEASFETVKFLSNKADELEVNSLMILDRGLVDLANTVNDNTSNKDCEVLELNSIQSITQEQINNNETYLKYMKENLEILNKALN